LRAVVDIEADSLDATQIWCVVAKDIDTGEVHAATSKEEALRLLHKVRLFIGHNVIGYDLPTLSRLWQYSIDQSLVVDTLVLSRLWLADNPSGHSLEAWGDELKHPKIHLDVRFDTYSDAILERCINDVELNHKVYNELMREDRVGGEAFNMAREAETKLAFICQDMHENGLAFDADSARSLRDEVDSEVKSIDNQMATAFPPKARIIREVTPKLTKKGTLAKTGISNWYEGTDYTIFTPDAPFTLVEWEPFNPGSTRQIIERLNDAGWQPTSKTKGHKEAEKARDKEKLAHFKTWGWSVNEENLATIPDTAPAAARLLVRRILLAARVRSLDEWLSYYNESTGRIHGRFNHIGARTQRMSHNQPNMGNIATKKSIKYNGKELKDLATELGGRMRSLWIAGKDHLLVGTDMESAHLRIFAHLIDDKEFTHALLSGRKEEGTDPHSVNKRVLGDVCVDRDRAKTFIFSFLNGAGVNKVSEIFGCSKLAAQEALDEFVRAYPGLEKLKRETIPRDAKQGYFLGLDGRKVACDSEHHMIGMYLQNAEKVIMTYANILWRKELERTGIPYRQVNFVHDEFVTEVEGVEDIAHMVGTIQSNAIRQVGEEFGLRCPLSGEHKIGKTWLDVH
jgi:DNA polymerase-1